jgi:hypothetical protein
MSFTSIETAHRMAAVEKKRKEGGDVMGTLTLRDYFAAKAMQAIVSNGDVDPQKISQASYIIADAMLKARDL